MKRAYRSVPFTARELLVIERLHLQNGDISKELGITLKSVESAIAQLKRKLSADTRVALALKAIAVGLIKIEVTCEQRRN